MNATDIATLNDRELSTWRSANIGFVFQQYNLLPVLNAVENVEMPLLLFSMSKDERRHRALAALDIVGLKPRAAHFPRQMSGGEEQRTAIARALVTDPKLVIADEPTGNLDAVAAANVLDLLQTLNEQHHKTILMVTHDPKAARSIEMQEILRRMRSSQTGHIEALFFSLSDQEGVTGLSDRHHARYFPLGGLPLLKDATGARFWAVALTQSMLTYFEVPARCRFESHEHESEQITLVLEG